MAMRKMGHDESFMVVAAFRYALGRSTYASVIVPNELRRLWHRLPVSDQNLIIREIDDADEANRLGDRLLDAPDWLRLRNEMKERKQEEESEPDECYSCGYESDDLKMFENDFLQRVIGGEAPAERLLCKFCAATHLDTTNMTRSNDRGDVKLYKSVAWIANRLLDEIREIKNDD
jgi:hypothetical protein